MIPLPDHRTRRLALNITVSPTPRFLRDKAASVRTSAGACDKVSVVIRIDIDGSIESKSGATPLFQRTFHRNSNPIYVILLNALTRFRSWSPIFAIQTGDLWRSGTGMSGAIFSVSFSSVTFTRGRATYCKISRVELISRHCNQSIPVDLGRLNQFSTTCFVAQVASTAASTVPVGHRSRPCLQRKLPDSLASHGPIFQNKEPPKCRIQSMRQSS